MLRALGPDGASRYAPLFLQIECATTVEQLWSLRDEWSIAIVTLKGKVQSNRFLYELTSVLIGA